MITDVSQIPPAEYHPFAFDPNYLADAIEIGATLRMADSLNPRMTTDPTRNFCVVIGLRFTEETERLTGSEASTESLD